MVFQIANIDLLEFGNTHFTLTHLIILLFFAKLLCIELLIKNNSESIKGALR